MCLKKKCRLQNYVVAVNIMKESHPKTKLYWNFLDSRHVSQKKKNVSSVLKQISNT